ncbi:hypothetical protein FB550_105146 [Neobacillus bataviensis]|uniref:Uncharacterized protein n=1 Tax=Neobacillus bataviensis TaxID=220685 RepID=A0A561DEM8_9BACI|nr:hypothetical protein FB550_105146 [Neobacillus bataviensis]
MEMSQGRNNYLGFLRMEAGQKARLDLVVCTYFYLDH